MSTSAVKYVSNVLHRFFMLEISAFAGISVSNPQMKKWAKIKILKNLTVKTFKKVHFAQFEFFRGGGQKSKNFTIKQVRKHRRMEPSNGRKSKQNSRRYLSGAEGPPPKKNEYQSNVWGYIITLTLQTIKTKLNNRAYKTN